MKLFHENKFAKIILLAGMLASLGNFCEGENHQNNAADDYRKSPNDESTKNDDIQFDEYPTIDLKRIQPQVSSSQYDYDYSNRDYPNYDHHEEDEHSKPSNPDDYENHDFDTKKESGGFVTHGLEKSIPGTAGMDYPNYNAMPRTEFNCQDHPNAGLYGDIETDCQMFHICQEDGRHDSFLCPVGTIFNQKHFICDWWFNYNCSETPQYFLLNSMIYQNPTSHGDNTKHKHSHNGRRGNLFLESIVKKMGAMMENVTAMKNQLPDLDNFNGKIDSEKNVSSKDGDLVRKNDDWEPMRRYRSVKVRKILLNPSRVYDLPREELPIDEKLSFEQGEKHLDRKNADSNRYMTTINYAIQLLHQKLNTPPNEDSPLSTISIAEYATASALRSNDNKSLSDILPDYPATTESTEIHVNTKNKQYLPAFTISPRIDDTVPFLTESYPTGNVTILNAAVSANLKHTQISIRDNNVFPSIPQNKDEVSYVTNDNSIAEPPFLINARNNPSSDYEAPIPIDREPVENQLPKFDSERQVPVRTSRKPPNRRKLRRHRKNFMMRRPGLSRLRWRHRLMKKNQKEIQPAHAPKNMTSFYKVKRIRKRKPSKFQPKVEWMLYHRNNATQRQSWNDFVRQRRQMLKAKQLMQNNEEIAPKEVLSSSLPSILSEGSYSTTVSVSTYNNNNNHSSKNERDETLTSPTKMNANEPINTAQEPDVQRNKKTSRIRVNRRCKAVCIKLIKNHLPNFDLEETEDGLYTLGTNNRNLQWQDIKRFPAASSITEYQPQVAESGSIISKESNCDENFRDSFSGWSIIIDKGTVTKEKTIKRKCTPKNEIKNKHKKNLIHSNAHQRNSDDDQLFSQYHQNNQRLWLENFLRRGAYYPEFVLRDEVLIPSESEESRQNEEKSIGDGISNYSEIMYKNRGIPDLQRSSTIDWKQKWLQDEILKVSTFDVNIQSQQPEPKSIQRGSNQHSLRDKAPSRNSNTEWDQELSDKSAEVDGTHQMQTTVIPLSKILWSPGARGSKVDWSQNTKNTSSVINIWGKNLPSETKNPKNVLPGETVTNIDSAADFHSENLRVSSNVNDELLAEFQNFLKGLKSSMKQRQSTSDIPSRISYDLNQKEVSSLTAPVENKHTDIYDSYLTYRGNVDANPPYSNEYHLPTHQRIHYLASGSLSVSENEEINDKNFENYALNHDYTQTTNSSSWPLNEQEQFQNGWLVDKPADFSVAQNITQNGESFNNKGAKNNWPFGNQNSQRNWGKQDLPSTDNSNNHKNFPVNAHISEKNSSERSSWNMVRLPHNSSTQKVPSLNLQTLQTGRFNDQRPQNVFAMGKQNTLNNRSPNNQHDQKEWSRNVEVPQRKGDQSGQKGRGSDNARSLKDWLFGIQDTQDVPSSDIQGQSKGWPSQTVSSRSGWSLDAQTPQMEFGDSNIRSYDKERSNNERQIQENSPLNKKMRQNRMRSDVTRNSNNRPSNNQKGQNKGGQSDSIRPQDSRALSGRNLQKGWQLDKTDLRNDGWLNDRPSQKSWSAGDTNSKSNLSSNNRQRNISSKGSSLNRNPSSNAQKGDWLSNTSADDSSPYTPNDDSSPYIPNDDSSLYIPKDDWPSNTVKGSSTTPKRDQPSNNSNGDWSSNTPKRDQSSNTPKRDQSSNNPKGDWSSNTPKRNQSSNHHQNSKGFPLDSFNTNEKGSSNSRTPKEDNSFDEGIATGDLSKLIEELKLSLQKLKTQIPDATRDPIPRWSSSYKGSNGRKQPQPSSENMQNKTKMNPSWNSKGNSRRPKNATMMMMKKKKIRWSVQIDGNGMAKGGWIPITLRPRLDNPTKSNDKSPKGDEEDDWKSWDNDPDFDSYQNKKDDYIDVSKAIDSQASENKLLWVLSINSTSVNKSDIDSKLPSILHQPNTKQEWSVPFDGTTIPASGWLPILNIKNSSSTKNRIKIQDFLPNIESTFTASDSTLEHAKRKRNDSVLQRHSMNITNNKISINATSVISNRNKSSNQGGTTQDFPEKSSPHFPNVSNKSNAKIKRKDESEQFLHPTILTPVNNGKISLETRAPPIVSNRLKSKLMQVGHNETLRILPFSLIHEQLNHGSKNEDTFKGSHLQILKARVLVESETSKFPSKNSRQSNITKSEKQFTTFTIGDGRLHPSQTMGHRPSTILEQILFSNNSDRTKISFPFTQNVTKFLNHSGVNDSKDGEPKEVITEGNIHKL